ncbi:MAG: hypothetical protein QXG40_04385 [Ignisphaera sp.]
MALGIIKLSPIMIKRQVEVWEAKEPVEKVNFIVPKLYEVLKANMGKMVLIELGRALKELDDVIYGPIYVPTKGFDNFYERLCNILWELYLRPKVRPPYKMEFTHRGINILRPFLTIYVLQKVYSEKE